MLENTLQFSEKHKITALFILRCLLCHFIEKIKYYFLLFALKVLIN